MPVVELFRALGEPTRLEMVKRLSHRGTHTITSLSTGLDITRQGARKHLQILADAKLVTLVPKGRDTFVELDQHSLDTAQKFIAKLEKRWQERLLALRDFVDGDK